MPLSPASTPDEIVDHLRSLGSVENRACMARCRISTERALGISNAALRPIGKLLGQDHDRALALWATGIREARLLAIFTDKPKQVMRAQADAMAAGFDSWEVVDHAAHLFCAAGLAHQIIPAFAADEREFVRRTAFSMIATACLHLKKEPDPTFLGWLGLIEAHATDGRNFVKKAVNWALRQTGKRSVVLHAPAFGLAQKLATSPDRIARWIGTDAVRELSAPRTLERLEARRR
ncbi:DNA alkylation repair protein [Pseudaminobacter sp. 19-2017]|uniref:DNA alkylation repair protein n=1 Tax=Pseudaminobacter soli (ex Zhang et al. 2022) TaxID=2831468 RepID=A0A942DUW8_9HYPH|nr:DNA alkylation repair protein [Pseudaminobacter soli]MBS3647144.1 DNA alkylation repair protein [Pseudaminobacter soli]